mmetsp:Transcript_1372/g.4151  ORF Transcript_1372/g.4151 Transcript_1372/m.4151 type:complete len:244 (-) Transcript_1372:1934-2665(-)
MRAAAWEVRDSARMSSMLLSWFKVEVTESADCVTRRSLPHLTGWRPCSKRGLIGMKSRSPHAHVCCPHGEARTMRTRSGAAISCDICVGLFLNFRLRLLTGILVFVFFLGLWLLGNGGLRACGRLFCMVVLQRLLLLVMFLLFALFVALFLCMVCLPIGFGCRRRIVLGYCGRNRAFSEGWSRRRGGAVQARREVLVPTSAWVLVLDLPRQIALIDVEVRDVLAALHRRPVGRGHGASHEVFP